MNDHADLGLIAAFREGLLDPATGERVGRHLEDCATCAGRQAALEAVTARLAEAPPPPLPPKVARGLDAALAAEIAAAGDARAGWAPGGQVPTQAGQAPVSAPQTGAGRAVPGAAPAPAHRRGSAATGRRRGFVASALRPLAAAAAVCLLAGGGYLLLRSTSASSPSSSAAAPSRTSVAHPSAHTAGGAANAPMMGSAPATGARSWLVVSSGTSYQPGQLRADARKVLQRYESSLAVPRRAADGAAPEAGGFPTQGCLRRVAGNTQPLIADRATYEGRQAVVIIAPARGTVAGHIWVVGMGCSDRTDDLITQSGL